MTYDAKPSWDRGYLFDTTEPLYPFGWGLTYSAFEVGAPRLSRATIGPAESVQVSIDVRNAGVRAGDETVQVYVRDKVASVTRPVKALKAFRRVTLAPGQSRTLTFTLDQGAFALWNEGMRRVVELGEFEIMAGADSARLKSATLTVMAGR
jgi:beta-glucosidase